MDPPGIRLAPGATRSNSLSRRDLGMERPVLDPAAHTWKRKY
jgi:hypothetical protein